MENIYKTKPKYKENDIPVFCEKSDYIKNYDDIAEHHLSHKNENPFIPEKQWIEMEDSTLELLKKYIKKNFKILDAGVGTGRILSRISGVKKFGVDISLEYLKASQSKKIEVCLAMLEDMPFYDNFFDIIICTDVLEHVLDLNKTLFEIKRILKPNGIFIFRVPYKEDLSIYLEKDYPYEYVHLRNFDEFSIRTQMEKILKFDTLEIEKTAFRSGKRKLRFFNIKILNSIYYRITSFIIKILAHKNDDFGNYLYKKINNPVEINWAGKNIK